MLIPTLRAEGRPLSGWWSSWCRSGLPLPTTVVPVALLPDGPDRPGRRHTLLPPPWRHPFGRDTVARVVAGTRILLLEIVASVGPAVPVEVPVGPVAGYAAQLLDGIFMAAMEVPCAFPGVEQHRTPLPMAG